MWIVKLSLRGSEKITFKAFRLQLPKKIHFNSTACSRTYSIIKNCHQALLSQRCSQWIFMKTKKKIVCYNKSGNLICSTPERKHQLLYTKKNIQSTRRESELKNGNWYVLENCNSGVKIASRWPANVSNFMRDLQHYLITFIAIQKFPAAAKQKLFNTLWHSSPFFSGIAIKKYFNSMQFGIL